MDAERSSNREVNPSSEEPASAVNTPITASVAANSMSVHPRCPAGFNRLVIMIEAHINFYARPVDADFIQENQREKRKRKGSDTGSDQSTA